MLPNSKQRKINIYGCFQMSNYKAGTEWEVLKAIPFNGKVDDDKDNYGILYVELQRSQSPQAFILTVPFVGKYYTQKN